MTQEQRDLLPHATEGLVAARQLHELGHYGFAASRAYYAMFYVAEAFLLGRDLSFSKHGAVHAAFGRYFAKPGIVPVEFHRHLIHAMELRHTGDYGRPKSVSAEDSEKQLRRAEEFIEFARCQIGRVEDGES